MLSDLGGERFLPVGKGKERLSTLGGERFLPGRVEEGLVESMRQRQLADTKRQAVGRHCCGAISQQQVHVERCSGTPHMKDA